MPPGVLLGDIGATNARFALLTGGMVGPVRYFSVADFPQFTDVVATFLRETSEGMEVRDAVLAVAGPVSDNRCILTNSPWIVDPTDLADNCEIRRAEVRNDFEATALALPYLAEDDLVRLGGGAAMAGAPMAVLGPGTGLGVSCLVPSDGGHVVIPSEGGHATFPATSHAEEAILDYLRARFGHVSAERVISGSGLENLYEAASALAGGKGQRCDAARITRAALAGSDPIAVRALDLFCAMLGSFAGNVALTFGARGGVYIAGGIAPRIADFLARSDFRQRFIGKGRFQSYLEAIPSSIIVHPAATFVGLRSIYRSASPGALPFQTRDERTSRSRIGVAYG
ncbi:MAG: glucokinase [Hyphomicrobiales bacterium]|nr:glucokinase [Hyphomicrobiales bacterium]